MKKQEKFKTFLVKHKAYRKFMANLLNDETNGKYSFKEYCRKEIKIDYIIGAFEWDDPLDKLSFWRELNDLWREELKK